MTTPISKIQLRRDVPANWAGANPILSAGEVGVELVAPVNRAKVGDGITAWLQLYYAGALVPTSSRGSPVAITAPGGITPNDILRELQFIAGSGGPVVVSASPQIAAGNITGQELVLICNHATNSVTLNNGTGLLLNGPCTLVDGGCLSLVWDGSVWSEVSRNDM